VACNSISSIIIFIPLSTLLWLFSAISFDYSTIICSITSIIFTYLFFSFDPKILREAKLNESGHKTLRKRISSTSHHNSDNVYLTEVTTWKISFHSFNLQHLLLTMLSPITLTILNPKTWKDSTSFIIRLLYISL
jgi:hypothetical protein